MADREEEELGASFRQSRRELWFMVTTWSVFAVWTVGYNATHAFGAGEGASIVWGLPRWVAFGVAIPWAIALALTIAFALFFMKDTDLGEVEEESKAKEANS